MSVRGLKAPLVVFWGVLMVCLKVSQLLAVTYDPATIDALPEFYIRWKQVVLLDLEDLSEQLEQLQDPTGSSALAETIASLQSNEDLNKILSSNTTARALDGAISALRFYAGENAFTNKFWLFSGICIFTCVLVVVVTCGGCISGERGRALQNIIQGVLGMLTGVLFIPMYHHLLQTLDCTYYNTGATYYKSNEDGTVTRFDSGDLGGSGSGSSSNNGGVASVWSTWTAQQLAAANVKRVERGAFHWDVMDPDSFEDKEDAECYGERHLFFLVVAMVSICLFQFPAMYFLCTKADSDLDEHRPKIIDAIIVQKKLPGRSLKTKDANGNSLTGAAQIFYAPGSAAFEMNAALQLPRLALRQKAVELLEGPAACVLEELDNRTCCANTDSQEHGISGIRKRPREAAIDFAIEAYLVTVSTMLTGGKTHHVEEVTGSPGVYTHDIEGNDFTTRMKMIGLIVGHVAAALFYCNPLALWGSKGARCTPYDDHEGTLSRGALHRMGYPYNYEPLNFVRAAGSMICALFALFQLLSFERMMASATAMDRWMNGNCAAMVVYLMLLILRYIVYRRDRSNVLTKKKKIKQKELKQVAKERSKIQRVNSRPQLPHRMMARAGSNRGYGVP
jgi:hypothetical protein